MKADYDFYPDWMAERAAEDRLPCGVCGGGFPAVDDCEHCGGSGREPRRRSEGGDADSET